MNVTIAEVLHFANFEHMFVYRAVPRAQRSFGALVASKDFTLCVTAIDSLKIVYHIDSCA